MVANRCENGNSAPLRRDRTRPASSPTFDLEHHGGRSIDGVGARVAQRPLALTAAIWHNRATGQPVTRSLTAYDNWSSSDSPV